ncbi:DUF3016 domain-containing protein [Lysobacter sp. KIS68-7]|uniref:DUF3016 domain-containing protein n=1 Tax=Lysobacter sp. KIS68-7 TaxID=2904252 RepID=UPI001E3E3691|nr:DUF3016 domain-containing protein [Lysobacter sp. KIS68-7]UHQ20691.1 DUF3016 domain-containing protein [Lysobacter sp. KIS68-7]
MKSHRLLSLALAGVLTACATGGITRVTDPALPHAVGEGTPVTVSWTDPAQFTEIRYSTNPRLASEGDWVVKLADYMAASTARAVPAGDKVDVQILDIQRAGQYEWSYGATSDLRILRDTYPPRIQLRFRHLDANGNVVAEGDRKLADLAYLMSPPPLPSSDTLRYEKRMIDQWVRREFVTRR